MVKVVILHAGSLKTYAEVSTGMIDYPFDPSNVLGKLRDGMFCVEIVMDVPQTFTDIMLESKVARPAVIVN